MHKLSTVAVIFLMATFAPVLTQSVELPLGLKRSWFSWAAKTGVPKWRPPGCKCVCTFCERTSLDAVEQKKKKVQTGWKICDAVNVHLAMQYRGQSLSLFQFLQFFIWPMNNLSHVAFPWKQETRFHIRHSCAMNRTSRRHVSVRLC